MGNELAGERQGALSLGIRYPHPVRAVVMLLLGPCSWLLSSPAFLEAGQLFFGILVLVNELTSWAGRGGECSLKLLPCASWIGGLLSSTGQIDRLLDVHLWSRVELSIAAPTCFKTCAENYFGGG